MENISNSVETELFNVLKYQRYTSTGIYIDCIWLSAGTTYWINDVGQLHREDGPAVEWSDGAKGWYQNGFRHREDGPAIEYPNEVKKWYLNGELHREDGPAVEYAAGPKEWWFNGKYIKSSRD